VFIRNQIDLGVIVRDTLLTPCCNDKCVCKTLHWKLCVAGIYTTLSEVASSGSTRHFNRYHIARRVEAEANRDARQADWFVVYLNRKLSGFFIIAMEEIGLLVKARLLWITQPVILFFLELCLYCFFNYFVKSAHRNFFKLKRINRRRSYASWVACICNR
jgi:hypothetical protein